MENRDESSHATHTRSNEMDLPAVVSGLMAGETLLPAQLPSPSRWSAEKRLAAAVLATALNDVQSSSPRPSHRRRLDETVRWIHSDDAAWPVSFLRLCALFDLDPDWVRAVVQRWTSATTGRRRMHYRHAA
jgi:hypothetical protein